MHDNPLSNAISESTALKLSAAAHPTRSASATGQKQPTKLCTPCPYPTTYVPDTDQFTPHQYTELALHFHGQIKQLWRKVWFGLYQVQDKNGPSHASIIRKLYAGAGMAELLGRDKYRPLDDMYRLFWGRWEMVGLGNLSTALYEWPIRQHQHHHHHHLHHEQPILARLKIYDGIALDNLQYMVMLLKEYEHQVDAIAELCSFLQQHQMDSADGEKVTMAHQSFLLREFRRRADAVAAALGDLDDQMLAFQRDMDNEAREIHGGLEEVESMVLREEVLL